MTAAALLRSYSKPSLERMARQRRLETKGQNKEALISMLAPILFDADAIRRALVALSPVERRVLDEVRLLDGDAPTGLIKRRLEREGTIQRELPRGSGSAVAPGSGVRSELGRSGPRDQFASVTRGGAPPGGHSLRGGR